MLLVFVQNKHRGKDPDDLWHRRLTLKVKFWHFLTLPHFTNSQNSIISFWVYWFLGKNLSNFVPPTWKHYNLYYHNLWTRVSILDQVFWLTHTLLPRLFYSLEHFASQLTLLLNTLYSLTYSTPQHTLLSEKLCFLEHFALNEKVLA